MSMPRYTAIESMETISACPISSAVATASDDLPEAVGPRMTSGRSALLVGVNEGLVGMNEASRQIDMTGMRVRCLAGIVTSTSRPSMWFMPAAVISTRA